MGERTPHLDPNARAAFIGLTASHTRAHLVRAILEGVAYSLKDTFTIFDEINVPSSEGSASAAAERAPRYGGRSRRMCTRTKLKSWRRKKAQPMARQFWRVWESNAGQVSTRRATQSCGYPSACSRTREQQTDAGKVIRSIAGLSCAPFPVRVSLRPERSFTLAAAWREIERVDRSENGKESAPPDASMQVRQNQRLCRRINVLIDAGATNQYSVHSREIPIKNQIEIDRQVSYRLTRKQHLRSTRPQQPRRPRTVAVCQSDLALGRNVGHAVDQAFQLARRAWAW